MVYNGGQSEFFYHLPLGDLEYLPELAIHFLREWCSNFGIKQNLVSFFRRHIVGLPKSTVSLVGTKQVIYEKVVSRRFL